jgi:hypothetical protein
MQTLFISARRDISEEAEHPKSVQHTAYTLEHLLTRISGQSGM